MALSDEFLQELRSKCDIEQVISPYVSLKRRGKNLVGLCPFHNEKTPSFTVYPESQSFYCFGCGAGGEVISFVRRINNLDFTEAVRTLCDTAGMSLPQDGFDDSMIKRRRRIFEINREAARFFYDYMMSDSGRKGLDYFLGRGLTMQTIKHFGLGYAPDSWDGLLKYMRGKGFSSEELYEANLVNKSTKDSGVRFYDNFRNRAMVPIIDQRGNVVAFGGRVLDDSKPKYVNTSDTPVYKKSLGVFGLNFAKNGNSRSLIIVEGYMDVIALHQAGFTNSIACLGTALTNEMAHLVSRYADEVILCYDSDEAGQKATKRALSVFGSIGGVKTRVLTMSGGKDPDEIIKKYGAERFRTLIEGAANDIEFRILKERDKWDVATSDGKLNFLKGAAQLLADTGDSITIDLYASRLSEETGVSKDAIMAQVRSCRRRTAREQEKKTFSEIISRANGMTDKINPQRHNNIRAANAEETLLASLMRNPDFFRKVEEKIMPADFVTDFNRKIYEKLYWRLKQGYEVDLTVLSADFTPEEMDEVSRIYRKGLTIGNTPKECRDCVEVIKEEKRKSKASAVKPSELSDEEYKALFSKKES